MSGNTPVETFLGTVTQQLYRATAKVGFWRLELLTGDRLRSIARICRDEDADLIVVPGQLDNTDVGMRMAIATGIPVACVYDTIERDYYVLLSAGSDVRSQRLARIAAAVIAPLHPVRSALWQLTDARVEVRQQWSAGMGSAALTMSHI